MIDLDLPMRGATIAVIDTETTGFESTARIVEVAVVRIERFGLPDARGELVYEQLVNPEQEIPWGAVQVHGIRDSMVRGKPTWDRVWPVVLEHLQEALPAAHNHTFDLRLLTAEALNLGLPAPPEKGSWLDSLTLMRRLDEKPATIEAACARRQIPPGKHRAGSDALATARLLWPLVRDCYQKPQLGAPLQPTVGQFLWWLHASKKERERAAPAPKEQGALLAEPKSGARTGTGRPTAMPPAIVQAVAVPPERGLKAAPAPVTVISPPPLPVQQDLLVAPAVELVQAERAPRSHGPRANWGVKGGVGGNMFLTPERGICGEWRWTISPKNARKFVDEDEAREVASKCGGTTHRFKVVLG